MNRKKHVALGMMIWCLAFNAEAQTFLDHLRHNKDAKGKVTVTQSTTIDELVNHLGATATLSKPANGIAKPANSPSAGGATATKPVQGVTKPHEKASEYAPAHRNVDTGKTFGSTSHVTAKPEKTEIEVEAPVVDMSKKVMRGSRKISGYRVQVFAGGNTRNDKLRAQQIGNAVKLQFPEEPIYVHFYSPRWICRMGNYRTYAEANRVLRRIRSMGYRSATIVKGKITVQY